MTSVIAHRGASALFTENTLEAFEGARDLGADWVELDVRRTADDVLAVHHDAHLEDGRALIDVPADDLPGHVPLLISALDVCGGIGVVIEVKNPPGDPDYDHEHRISESVAALVLARDTGDRVRVTSQNMDALGRIKALAPGVDTGWICFDLVDPAQAIDRCVAHGHPGFHPFDRYVDRALVERAHRAGLHIYPWVVDDAERMAELVELGVDGIITKRPAVAREVVDATD